MDSLEEEFNRIYDETYSSCLIYVSCKCKKIEDVWDIMQEIYMALYKSILKHGSAYIENSEAYVISIAKSKLANYYREGSLQKIVSLFVRNKKGEEYNRIDGVRDILEKSIEDDLINRETIEELWYFLKSKSDDIQKIFFLYYGMDLTIKEIAEAMEMGESNVKNKLYRTRNEMRNRFKKEGGIYE